MKNILILQSNGIESKVSFHAIFSNIKLANVQSAKWLYTFIYEKLIVCNLVNKFIQYYNGIESDNCIKHINY